MPCYFARMMNAYFNVESEEKWGDTSEEYSGVIYDFVNHTIDNFGIGSWTVNTTNEKRQLFANWGYIIYSVVTNDVELHQFEDIEIDAFAKLQTTFADLTQDILSFANLAITPLINLLYPLILYLDDFR